MAGKSLKRSTFDGFFWKFSERLIASSVTVIVSIILARLLLPEDYSAVGIIAIFFSIASIFISNGLNTALIQKKDADPVDYSTVMIVNVAIAAGLYLLLFAFAPLIASLYKMPLLTPLLRVMGLTLIINAVKAILCAYISNKLEFRRFFLATIVGTLISAVIGIWMALRGFGPWALVAQQMSNEGIDTVLLWFTTRVKFVPGISKERLKGLFSFGWKMFASAMINEIYENVSPLIIGLRYTAADLAYYSKGRMYPKHVNSVVSDTFSAVLFPVMSKLQDEKERLLFYTRSFIRTGSYVLFPMMTGFLTVSDNFIKLLLTDKWLPASVYMKIFCVGYMFDVMTRGNLQAIKALGRSDVYLILDIIKKSAYAVVLFSFLFLTDSPDRFAFSVIVNSLIALVVNAIPNGALLGYRIRLQFADMLPPLLMSAAMGIPVYLMNRLPLGPGALLALQIAAGVGIYLVLSLIFKPYGFVYGVSMAKEILHGKKGG